MGKIRTRTIGLEDVEEKQKKEQKKRSDEKKMEKKKAEKEVKAEEKEEKKVKVDATEEKLKAKVIKEKKEEKKSVKVNVRGKKYQQVKKKVDQSKKYTLEASVVLLKKLKYANFDESVELHLNVDEAGLKGEVELPHATGKTVRVQIVDDKVLESLEKGQFEFDILIAHPSYMPKLAKFARVLGPKGLMPNPKAGTISPNPEQVAKKFEKGTLRWKTEAKFPLVHQMIGKVSFEDKNLVENAETFLNSIGKAHIKDVFIKTTMSPSLKLDIEKI